MQVRSGRKWHLLLISVLIFTHAYCLVVGIYRLPPFNQLQWLKRSVSGNTNNVVKSPWIKEKGPIYEYAKIASDTIVFLGDSITQNCEWHELLSTA